LKKILAQQQLLKIHGVRGAMENEKKDQVLSTIQVDFSVMLKIKKIKHWCTSYCPSSVSIRGNDGSKFNKLT